MRIVQGERKMDNSIKDNGQDFEISLRILGNEFIGLKISVNDIKQKWIVMGIVAIGALAYVVGEFGPKIVGIFQ